MAGRTRNISTFIPFVLSAISFLLVLLVLLSGVNNGLADLFYLKTNVAALNLPVPLAGSQELQDLTTVSGTDYVGEGITAQSLGLADEYTISLLTSCARTASGPSCSAPRVGFWFNPGSQLRLDGVGLQSTYPPEYLDALAVYNNTAYAMAFFFIFSAVLLGLSVVLGALGATVLASVGVLSTVVMGLAVLAAMFLLAGNAAAVHVFRRLGDAFNVAFADQGLSASLGPAPIVLGWLAFILATASAAILVLRRRGDSVTRGRRVTDKSMFGDFNAKGSAVSSVSPVSGEKPKGAGGLLGRIPLLGRHKYTQLGGQPALGLSAFPQGRGGATQKQQQQHRGADDDWSTEYEHPRRESPVRGVAEHRIPGGAGQARQQRQPANMAYEPYSSALQ